VAGDVPVQIKLMEPVKADEQDTLSFTVRSAMVIGWTGVPLEERRTGNENYECYQQYRLFHNYLLGRGASGETPRANCMLSEDGGSYDFYFIRSGNR
jgi:hypothetical protein